MESLQSNNTLEQKNTSYTIHIVKPCNIIQINDNCVTNPFYHGKWEFKNICPQCNVEDGTVVTSPGSQKYISGHPPFNTCQTCKERKN